MGDNKSDTLGAKIQLFYRLGHISPPPPPPFPQTNVVFSYLLLHIPQHLRHFEREGGAGYQRINATSK